MQIAGNRICTRKGSRIRARLAVFACACLSLQLYAAPLWAQAGSDQGWAAGPEQAETSDAAGTPDAAWTPDAARTPDAAETPDAVQGSDAHAPHPHHLAVFVGATSNFEAEHTDLTLGVDYEYRLPIWNQLIGIGAFGEVVLAEHTEWLLGVPVVVHPAGGLKLLVGAGAAIVEEHAHFLLRMGAGYDFHLGRFSITPTLSADLVEGHLALAYGIGLGVGF